MNKHEKIKRAGAVLLLILISGTFISLLICLIRNAAPSVILAHLFCLMIIPCMFYGIRLFMNALGKRKSRDEDFTEHSCRKSGS